MSASHHFDPTAVATKGETSPVHLVICVDTSGSMSRGERIINVRKWLAFYVPSVLSAGDRVGLLSFSDKSTVQLPLDDYTVEKFASALESIPAPCGGTKLFVCAYDGLKELVNAKEGRAEASSYLLILTDGVPDPEHFEMLESYLSNEAAAVKILVGLIEMDEPTHFSSCRNMLLRLDDAAPIEEAVRSGQYKAYRSADFLAKNDDFLLRGIGRKGVRGE